jgi:hypothetical protein
VFGGVSLAFRGLVFIWLGCFSLLSLAVSCKMSWLVVIIVVSFRLFFESPRGLSDLTILLRCGSYYLIYLVRMAILFLRGRNVLLFRCYFLRFLGATSKVII